jgi:hypothetical protein
MSNVLKTYYYQKSFEYSRHLLRTVHVVRNPGEHESACADGHLAEGSVRVESAQDKEQAWERPLFRPLLQGVQPPA